MALPILPIILAVTALGSGIVQGISSVKNAKAESKILKQQAEEQMNERARQAKKLMSQQKTSFLKGGVFFNSGSPLEILKETADVATKDINAMANDANKNIKNLMRQGKTAFFSSGIEGILNGAMSFLTGTDLMGKAGKASSKGKLATKIQDGIENIQSDAKNWYNQKRGWTRGGFGSVDGTDYKIS